MKKFSLVICMIFLAIFFSVGAFLGILYIKYGGDWKSYKWIYIQLFTICFCSGGAFLIVLSDYRRRVRKERIKS